MTALIATAVLTASVARAQTPTTPQQDLDAASASLRSVSASAKTEAGQQIEELQKDFAEFMSAYAQRGTRMNAAGAVDASADANWRAKYLIVEADLTTLLGPADAASGGAPGLDARTRSTLEQARTRLGTFYASTLDARAANPIAHTGSTPGRTDAPVPPTGAAPQTPGIAQPSPTQRPAEQVAAPTPTPAAPASAVPDAVAPAQTPEPAPASVVSQGDVGTALVLLDRMRAMVADALDTEKDGKSKRDAVGTSGTLGSSGRVTVDRATLDEILAEIVQLKAMLRR